MLVQPVQIMLFLSAELGELRPDVSRYHDVRAVTASASYILLVRTRAFTSGNNVSESKNCIKSGTSMNPSVCYTEISTARNKRS